MLVSRSVKSTVPPVAGRIVGVATFASVVALTVGGRGTIGVSSKLWCLKFAFFPTNCVGLVGTDEAVIPTTRKV